MHPFSLLIVLVEGIKESHNFLGENGPKAEISNSPPKGGSMCKNNSRPVHCSSGENLKSGTNILRKNKEFLEYRKLFFFNHSFSLLRIDFQRISTMDIHRNIPMRAPILFFKPGKFGTTSAPCWFQVLHFINIF